MNAFNFVAYSPASLHFFEKKLDWKSVQYVLLFWEKIRYKVRHVRAPLLQAVSSWSITFLEEGLEEAGAASMSDAVSSASDTDARVEGKKKRGGTGCEITTFIFNLLYFGIQQLLKLLSRN